MKIRSAKAPRAEALGPVMLICLACSVGDCGSLVVASGDADPAVPAPEFDDVSEAVGLLPRSPSPRAYGPFWADLDGNGWLDLLFVNHSGKDLPSVYLNREGRRFESYFDRSGIPSGSEYPQSGDRHGGSAGDFDNDGDLDLIFARGAMRGETLGVKFDQLLRNRGDGTFEDFSKEAGAENAWGRARTPSWVDYDRDGWLDLYCGNAASANVLYKNDNGTRFVDATDGSNLGLVQAYTQAWSDYDNDGWPDVLTLPRPTLFRNQGDGVFVDVSERTGLRALVNRHGLTALAQAWGDYDSDGDQDVFLSGFESARSALLRNDASSFSVAAADFGGEEGEKGGGVAWGDADNDGDLDLLVLTSRRMRLFLNGGAGFTPIEIDLPEEKLGLDADAAFADFDRDGALDIAFQTAAGNRLLRSRGATGAWLQILLEGVASNRQGLGAKLRATGSGRTVFREHFGESGTLYSSGSGPVHFGLGRDRSVTLEIEWPSGRRQVFEDLPTKHYFRVVEPAATR